MGRSGEIKIIISEIDLPPEITIPKNENFAEIKRKTKLCIY